MPIAAIVGAGPLTPGNRAELLASLAAMARTGVLTQPSVHALQGCAMAVDNAAACVQQDGIAVAFEGRLFDAETSLAVELRSEAVADESRQPSLVWSAYRRWGDEFALHLDGEFTACVYDEARQRLLATRDCMGRGSIHFYERGEQVLLATEPCGLFAFSGVHCRANLTQVAALGTLRPLAGETCYTGVRFPPAGHVLQVQSGRSPKVKRAWFPERQAQLNLGATQDYAEALQAAMHRAVRVRLPATGPVATELSSGYDSSVVTALAARALWEQNRPLIAYTAVPVHATDGSEIIPTGIADEWPLASKVAAMYPNIEHVAVPTSAAPWQASVDSMTELLAGPPTFLRNLPWMFAARSMAQARGVQVVLNGQNGNLAGSYDGAFALFDLRRRHTWGQLARTAAAWHQAGTGWRSLLMRALSPTNATRSRVRRLLRKPLKSFSAHSLMRPEFIRSAGVALPEETPLGLPVEGDRTSGAARRYSIMQMVDFGGQYAAERRMFGVERSDPTADRRLVELCLSFPDEVFCPGGHRRELYRQAMHTVLPPGFLTSTVFGVQASDFLENFGAAMPLWLAMVSEFEHSPAVRDCLDLPRLRALLEAFPGTGRSRGESDALYNYTVGNALTVGRFLLLLERGNH